MRIVIEKQKSVDEMYTIEIYDGERMVERLSNQYRHEVTVHVGRIIGSGIPRFQYFPSTDEKK